MKLDLNRLYNKSHVFNVMVKKNMIFYRDEFHSQLQFSYKLIYWLFDL